MKPSIFIGSSVEGLNVAYAIQQNLTHSAECTVWDQGIFDLSKTSIETIEEQVKRSDFGIFVFSPDDEVKMRESEYKIVRDNVIFEFGLFIGELGRERVFFITPDNAKMHLPTDILGVTGGTYDPNRQDSSLQAATGPFCNQVRELLKKLYSNTSGEERSEDTETTQDKNKLEWLDFFFEDNFDEAKNKLTASMRQKDGEELIRDRAFLAYIALKEDRNSGLEKLLSLLDEHGDSKELFAQVSQILSWENLYEKSIEVIDRAIKKFGDESRLLVMKSEYLSNLGDQVEAIDLLEDKDHIENPEVAIALSQLYESNDSQHAISILHAAYLENPNDEELSYRYARLLQEHDRHKEAIYLLNLLCKTDIKNPTYLGYLSNSCLQLDLYEKAMTALHKANELAQEEQAWLIHNIGNLLNNKGFYSEAEKWLRKGLEIETSSEYALDRLARAVKSRNEEEQKFTSICQEGLQLLRATPKNVEKEDK